MEKENNRNIIKLVITWSREPKTNNKKKNLRRDNVLGVHCRDQDSNLGYYGHNVGS